MDWIKVLNRHVIFEYSDLSDSEFRAWIKIMSLTAFLESMPTREQMLQYVHHKTLTSLQDKLKTHSTTLQDVLKKVLSDAQEVVIKRQSWKDKKKALRELNKNVSREVLGEVQPQEKRREEKRREENKKNKDNIGDGDELKVPPENEKQPAIQSKPDIPEWIPKEPWDGFVAMRKEIQKPLTGRAIQLAINKLQDLKNRGHDPRDVLDQSTFGKWQGLYEFKGNGNGGNGNRSGESKAFRKAGGARSDGATYPVDVEC